MPKPKEYKTAKLFKSRNNFRAWLKDNSDLKKELWLVIYKKHTGNKSISYEEAVEEAICYGWIDGKMKRVDDEKHIIRFSPRKASSVWSKLNKDRALKMIRTRKMTKAGEEIIKQAKKSGRWQVAYSSKSKIKVPPFIKKELSKNKKVWENFNKLSISHQNRYIYWILDTKSKETQKRRISKTNKLLSNIKK